MRLEEGVGEGMKGGRDDDKVMGPLFPRLHVNDADKGGPRAPPRNKMALYELFSIPSQRFNSDAAPPLPLPPHRAGSLVPSATSSQAVLGSSRWIQINRSCISCQETYSVRYHNMLSNAFVAQATKQAKGCGHERTMSTPFCASSVPVLVAENVHTRSMEGSGQNTMGTDLERKSLKRGSERMVNTSDDVQVDVECSSLHPDFSSEKDSFGKKFRDQDVCRVPTCVKSEIARLSDKDDYSMDRERTTNSHLNILQKSETTAFISQSQVQSSHDKFLELHSTNNLMPREQERSNDKRKPKEVVTLHKSMEDCVSHPSMTERAADPLNICKLSSNQEHSCSRSNELGSSQSGSARLSQESHGNFREARHLNDAEGMEKREDADKADPSEDAYKNGTLEDADINDVVSETSVVDPIPGVDISPDDVVGLIGPKHFWKARRAIVNQQRVFAVQIFELHRLIKVQKLIAASPHMLLEDTYSCNSPKVLVKDMPANFLAKRQLQIVKQKGESCKVNNNSECATEHTAAANFLVKPKLQVAKQNEESRSISCNSGCLVENTAGILPLTQEHGNGNISQLLGDGNCNGKRSSFPMTPDNKEGTWCFHPPGNQWLIPVMSPSEGLIYKPYTGLCPPTGAFMASAFSGCGPVSVSPLGLASTAFGVPVSHQQQSIGFLPGALAVAPNYLRVPYGLPVVHPLVSSSPVQQARRTAGPWPSGQLQQHSWSSCNMSNPKNEAFSELAGMVQISEDNDLQGSTASFPGDTAHGGREALPLLHTTASVECPDRPPQVHSEDYETRVIKVVPHNRRSASESAARIFWCIQRERQQHDSV